MSSTTPWNLLVLSDLHLGDQLPGEDRARVHWNAEFLSHHFGGFLDYYAHHRVHQLPWRLLIAGDMIDFMRLHVPSFPEDEEAGEDSFITGPSLGAQWQLPPSTVEGALQKLDQVFSLHHKTFCHLAQFLLEGHEVVLITGNHDAEFNWREVQESFREHLYRMASTLRPGISQQLFFKQIRFMPWFYYEPGRIYVEHGHLYDRYCNIENFLALPHEQQRQEEELLSWSHFATHYQYRSEEAFSGLPMEHLDKWGAMEIASWILTRPTRQKLLLGLSILAMTWRLMRTAWSSRYRHASALPADKKQQVFRQIAQQQELPVEAIEPLQNYIKTPIHNRLFDSIQSLYLDRMCLVVVTSTLLTIGLVAPWPPALRAALLTLTSVCAVALYLYLAQRHPAANAAPALFASACKIASHLQTPLIVFGHSHKFERHWLSQSQLYVNLGSWIPPLPPEAPEAPAPSAGSPPSLPHTPPYAIPSIEPYETPYLVLIHDPQRDGYPGKDHISIGHWKGQHTPPTLHAIPAQEAPTL